METPLARQLQQAWLETQMRKQCQMRENPPSSLSVTSNSNGYSSSSIHQFKGNNSRFASSSRVSDMEGSQFASEHFDITDDESFQDPVLQYINDMLMDEDMEDRKCMLQECTSYHSTVQEFYDIMEKGSGSRDLGDAIQNVDFLQDLESANVIDKRQHHCLNDLLDVADSEGEPAPVDASVQDFGPEVLLQVLDSALQPISTADAPVASSEIVCQEEDVNMVKQCTASQFVGFKENGSQHIIDTNTPNIAGKDDVLSTHFSAGQKSQDKVPFEIFEVSSGRAPFGMRNANKRTATYREYTTERLPNMAFESSPQLSKGVLAQIRREDVCSYVQNENLQAEMYAKYFQEGSNCEKCEVRSSSSRAIEEYAGPLQTMTVCLSDLLVECAQAVAGGNIARAHEILQELRKKASPYGSGLQRVSHYFTEGLFARLSGTGGRLFSAFTNNTPSAAKLLKAHHLFVEISPTVKVSYYFANKAILEAAKGASRLHIVDYGILYGLQWPFLISALAERKGGPPILKITGIDFPQPGFNPAERVEITGRRLTEYAKTYGVPFEYHAVASQWDTIQPSSLHLKRGEVLVVNSMYRLHHVLDETVLPSNPRRTLFTKICRMNPKIFVQGIKHGTYNSPFFMPRFKEALHWFTWKFEMLGTLVKRDNQERMLIEREVLGRDILNVVACEGPERVVRPETYQQWQNRTQKAGFKQVPLDQRVFQMAKNIVRAHYDKGFGVYNDGDWMLIGWKGEICNALSLWKPV